MKTRQEFMAEIEFESRKRSGKTSADITLTMNRNGNKVNIYFRNGTKEHFRDGVMFGIYKNRIILEPNASIGYSITVANNSKTDYGFIGATVSDAEKYRDWIGDYALKWDEFYEFWYIEKEV